MGQLVLGCGQGWSFRLVNYQYYSMKLVSLLLVSLLMVGTGKGHMVIKRQAVEETNPDSFHLFGQIFGSLVRLFGTVVEEGGNFLAKQAEANESVPETMGNISSTIGQSDFVQGVQGGAGTVVRGTSCLLMCSLIPQGEGRRDCEERNCQSLGG